MVQVSHVFYLSEKPGQNPFSGAENHVMQLSASLAKRGVDVQLIVLLWNDGPTIQKRLREIEQEGVAVEVVRRQPAPLFDSRITRALVCWWKLFRLLEKRRHRVIHVHLDLIAAVLAARLAGCDKLVVSIHSDEPAYSRTSWRIWLAFIDSWIAGYIGITNHVKTYYTAVSGIAPDKMVTVYYGVEAPRGSRSARKMWGVPTDVFLVGFVGRLTKQKNLHVFLEAMKRVPEATAIVIGDGPLREELEKTTRRQGIGNVRFVRSAPDAAALMPSFDVFCLPSKWEGLGLVLVEAMLQGVPIIGSRAGAIPEVLGNGKYGILFDPTRADELAERVRYAITHTEKMKTFAEGAMRYARRTFSIDTMADQTLAVYRKRSERETRAHERHHSTTCLPGLPEQDSRCEHHHWAPDRRGPDDVV